MSAPAKPERYGGRGTPFLKSELTFAPQPQSLLTRPGGRLRTLRDCTSYDEHEQLALALLELPEPPAGWRLAALGDPVSDPAGSDADEQLIESFSWPSFVRPRFERSFTRGT